MQDKPRTQLASNSALATSLDQRGGRLGRGRSDVSIAESRGALLADGATPECNILAQQLIDGHR
jgi:hypothetical protein